MQALRPKPQGLVLLHVHTRHQILVGPHIFSSCSDGTDCLPVKA